MAVQMCKLNTANLRTTMGGIRSYKKKKEKKNLTRHSHLFGSPVGTLSFIIVADCIAQRSLPLLERRDIEKGKE